MAGTVSAYKYTSDDGTDYKLRMSDADAAVQTGTAATTEGSLPVGYHPRHIFIEATVSSVKYRRKRIILEPTTAQWTGAASTWSEKLFPTDASPTSFTVRGRIGERRFALS